MSDHLTKDEIAMHLTLKAMEEGFINPTPVDQPLDQSNATNAEAVIRFYGLVHKALVNFSTNNYTSLSN